MSTKAIREALESVRWDGLSGKERPSYVAALSEVEAIENAANIIAETLDNPRAVTDEQFKHACSVFKAIAKEAK